MKLDEVKNLIRKGSQRKDAFANDFLKDAQAACTGGVGSKEWKYFLDRYFANDPDTLQNLGQWAKDLCSSPYGYGTAAVLTSGGGCRCVTYYDSDPYYDGGAGGSAAP